MDEIILRAGLAGVILAATLGPLGSLVVWRRMAYFGDTIAHASLLGVALSLLTAGAVPLTFAIFGVAMGVALLLGKISRGGQFHSDTLLGLLAHGTLALGVLLVSMAQDRRVDVNAYLFGDVLLLGWQDVATLAAICTLVLGLLWHYWRPLLMLAIDPTLAHVEGVPIRRMEQLLTCLLAAVIAVAIQMVGALLITALLIIPAAAARHLARSPAQMAVGASIVGAASVLLGLAGSLEWDAPTGPLMVVVAVGLFGLFGLFGAVATLRTKHD